MRVATVDGLVTLFYDGSKELYNEKLYYKYIAVLDENGDLSGPNEDDVELLNLSEECKNYFRERLSWQQIIIVDGVTEIPAWTFYECYNIKRVIFANTVMRIEESAFLKCKSLVLIKLSVNLEYIGERAFGYCNLLSVFIPPSCGDIDREAFEDNKNLAILNVTQDAVLQGGRKVISSTELSKRCFVPFSDFSGAFNAWLKNINNGDQFALHRVCSSFKPTLDMIMNTMKEKGGPKAFKVENRIGITPSRYLNENPYVDVTEKEIIKKYIMQMVGEL
ncbi:hypothetical protein CTEN210_09168 [Chaetoceros tenuissimus]|uniref:Leucine-rich repeat domain-containing protein n=1 Tax=Chaetoceros tenuissimus TaxID=426638 RepID=A0AAD3CUX4_9STRA|nr:hypothetical protein CTEN210_09168 [Chaetoceros tenuissimus]